ncbi:MAG TPA: hypothetical protein VIP77_10905 [Jiangellaceae bacterium]
MRRVLVAAVAALALVVGASPGWAASETIHLSSKGQRAEAFFSSVDPSGCIVTDVFVTANDGKLRTGSGGPSVDSFAFMVVSQFDTCTSTALIESNGTATLEPGEFQIDKFDTATLDAAVELFDSVSGTSFVVDVDVRWSGVGATTTEKAHFQTMTETFKINRSFLGTFRSASAVGTVADGGTNLTPAPAVFALLADVKTSELTVIHL